MRRVILGLTALAAALGAAGARADLIHYSWSGRVESVPGDSNPWFLAGDRLAATPDDGTVFTLDAVVEAGALDQNTSQANLAIFEPAYVTLTIGGSKATVTAPRLVLESDAFTGLFDSITMDAQVTTLGTTLSFGAQVRLDAETFDLASPGAADPPPLFVDTFPIQFGGSGLPRLITFAQNAPVTSRYEICGRDANLPVAVDWTTPATGTADGIDVAVDGLAGPGLDRFDLKGAAFEAAEQCSTAQLVTHGAGSDWILTLSAPARTLLVYVYSWRGPGAGVDPTTLQFDSPFTIRSGLTDASVENGGTRLSLPATAFHDGILRFDGPISSLSVDTNSTANGEQALTFALIPERPTVTYALDRTLGPSLEDGLTVTGTVTVDEAGVVTDWELTIASALLGRAITLDPDNSTFHRNETTLTPTATQLTIDAAERGLFGANLRDDAVSLRHEWFLLEENGTHFEQASLNFADPDPDAVFTGAPRANPVILSAVPEPRAGAGALASLAALVWLRQRGHAPTRPARAGFPDAARTAPS